MTRTPTAEDRRTSRAARVARERAVAQAADRRRHRRVVTAASGTVVALVVALGVGVQATRDSVEGPTGDPRGIVGGGVVLGSADAPVTVVVYEDFLCPACRAADARLGASYDALLEEEAIRLEHRPIAILDGYSTDRYSSRALNAAACVADADVTAYPAFSDGLFAAQPVEGGPGLTDSDLAEIASAAGAPDVGSCIADGRFADWARRTTDDASRAGVNSTPTILVGGTPLQEWTDEALRSAVSAATQG